ncbi:hypothetical protein BRD00_11630 [Halobacteriales archaeon QS_8_69_26]|nr:MAG: hypothetical protein BRD00_11630 [Halobacteriales archaeon QS_8_69_26]
MDPESRRRDLLRALTGVAATAGLGGLAGCIDRFDGEGGGTTVGGDGTTDDGGPTPGDATTTAGGATTTEETTEAETTEEGTPTGGDASGYTEWVPAPSALGMEEGEYFLFSYLDVSTVREHSDRFDESAYAGFERSLSSFGPVPEVSAVESLVTLFVGTGGSLVLTVRGSFAAETVANAVLEEQGGGEAGEYGEYALYESAENAAAVRDGTAVIAQGMSSEGLTKIKTVVDARRGEADRFVASDDAATLVDELGVRTSALGARSGDQLNEPYDKEALSVLGLSTDVTDDRARFEEVHVYESASAVDVDRSRKAATSGVGTLTGVEDVSTSQSGRVVVVGATVPIEDLGLGVFGPNIAADTGGDEPTPEVSFEFDYDADAGSVTITHAGGDVLSEENTGGLRYGREGGALHEWSLPVSAGDSVTLSPDGGLESGDEVLIVWEGPDGEQTELLGSYTVP